MCLLNQQKVDKPYDAVGYKIVRKNSKGLYQTPFARTPVYKKKWLVAQPVWYAKPTLAEYGFHAYTSIDAARKALVLHQSNSRWPRRSEMKKVIIEVELSDIFQKGNDASFEKMYNDYAVVACAMRVIKEVV